jgi:phage terminase small subunit
MPKTDRKDKIERFVEEYLVDLNATQAYLRSHPGVTDGTARTESSKLLAKPDIQDRIAAAKLKRSNRTRVTQDRIVRELARIAFVDLRRAYDKRGELLAVPDLPADVARAIAGVDVEDEYDCEDGPGGDKRWTATRAKKLKLQSKIRALEVLLEHVKTTDGDGKDLAETFAELAAEAEDWEKNGGDGGDE